MIDYSLLLDFVPRISDILASDSVLNKQRFLHLVPILRRNTVTVKWVGCSGMWWDTPGT